jgi:hypothetical protein
VAEPLSLEQFLRDRVDEDVLAARSNVAGPAPASGRRAPGSAERAQALTEAIDRWEQLEGASTAQRDGRPELAAWMLRGLAANYAAHPELRPEWLPKQNG